MKDASNISVRQLAMYHISLKADIDRLVPQLTVGAPEMTTNHFYDLAHDKNTKVFAAYDGDHIVGLAILATVMQLTGRKYWIEDVVVDQKYRGQGVGSQLIEYIVGSVPKGSKLRLTSRPERGTKNFYLRLGFKPRQTDVYEFDWQSKE